MNDAAYEEFQKEFLSAVKEILAEKMMENGGMDPVDLDSLALAVKGKFPKVEWAAVVDGIMRLTRNQVVETTGYSCKMSVMDMLASL